MKASRKTKALSAAEKIMTTTNPIDLTTIEIKPNKDTVTRLAEEKADEAAQAIKETVKPTTKKVVDELYVIPDNGAGLVMDAVEIPEGDLNIPAANDTPRYLDHVIDLLNEFNKHMTMSDDAIKEMGEEEYKKATRASMTSLLNHIGATANRRNSCVKLIKLLVNVNRTKPTLLATILPMTFNLNQAPTDNVVIANTILSLAKILADGVDKTRGIEPKPALINAGVNVACATSITKLFK